MMLKPHLVLDGAQLVARAIGADIDPRRGAGRAPGGPEGGAHGARGAVRCRRASPATMHVAECRFVAGESSAVLELLSGRPNLPVTTSRPSAISGLGGRPTVLSNAETYAQTAVLVRDGIDAYCSLGTHAEPGTRLLTIDGDGERPTVLEVAHGTRLAPLLAAADADADNGLLLGGYHGTWLPPEAVPDLTVSATAMLDAGAAIGAGVMLPLRAGVCPVRRTAVVVGYLAGESANRCGPCKFGLPALAHALRDLAIGAVRSTDRVIQLMDAVERRGACHHPDGTTRSIRSLHAGVPARGRGAPERRLHGRDRPSLSRQVRGERQAASSSSSPSTGRPATGTACAPRSCPSSSSSTSGTSRWSSARCRGSSSGWPGPLSSPARSSRSSSPSREPRRSGGSAK